MTVFLGIKSRVKCPKCQQGPRLYGHKLVNCEIGETMSQCGLAIDRWLVINKTSSHDKENYYQLALFDMYIIQVYYSN